MSESTPPALVELSSVQREVLLVLWNHPDGITRYDAEEFLVRAGMSRFMAASTGAALQELRRVGLASETPPGDGVARYRAAVDSADYFAQRIVAVLESAPDGGKTIRRMLERLSAQDWQEMAAALSRSAVERRAQQ